MKKTLFIVVVNEIVEGEIWRNEPVVKTSKEEAFAEIERQYNEEMKEAGNVAEEDAGYIKRKCFAPETNTTFIEFESIEGNSKIEWLTYEKEIDFSVEIK